MAFNCQSYTWAYAFYPFQTDLRTDADGNMTGRSSNQDFAAAPTSALTSHYKNLYPLNIIYHKNVCVACWLYAWTGGRRIESLLRIAHDAIAVLHDSIVIIFTNPPHLAAR